MTKQASIAYLSDLMDHPGRISDADISSIGGFRQSFPYFVPARYLEAYHKNKTAAFSPALLSSMNSYMGDWMLFCDFLNADTSYATQQPAPVVAAEKEPLLEVPPTMVEPLVPPVGISEGIEPLLPASVDAALDSEISPPPIANPIATVEGGVDAVAPVNEIEHNTTNGSDTHTVVPADEAATVNTAVANAVELQEEPIVAALAVDTAEEKTVVDSVNAVTETASPNANDVFASLLATTENSVATTVPDANDIDAITPPTETPVTVDKTTLNSLITDDVIQHIEAQHEQFWTGSEKNVPTSATPAETVATKQNENIRNNTNDKPLIYPVYTDDYFLQQGEKIPANMPQEIDSLRSYEHRSLMVMMSFSEWLLHFKSTTERQKEENKDQKALKSMWQKEKLAAAIEEENEEIPENVFEMAVNSITREDGLMSESLAEIYVKQGKLDKAVEMYRKLSLRNPQKNAYFADKIKEILKENQS